VSRALATSPSNERRHLAALALEQAAEELAEREGITPLQAWFQLRARSHILRIERRMNRRDR